MLIAQSSKNVDQSLSCKCDRCRKYPANHTIFLREKEKVCCRCYIIDFNGSPADWHPLCIKTYEDTHPQPKQKFHFGDVVTGKSFKGEAVIEYSYVEQYGGFVNPQHEYSLIFPGGGTVSWFYEDELKFQRHLTKGQFEKQFGEVRIKINRPKRTNPFPDKPMNITPKRAIELGYKVEPASAFEVGLTRCGEGIKTWFANEFGNKLPTISNPRIMQAINWNEATY